MTTSIHFGDFELAPEAYRLRHRDQAVHLEPKVFEVLAYLVQHRDRVVPKRELLDRLWPGDFVTDSALSRAIRDLRRALDEADGQTRWVQTVYGRGFRFCGDVREGEAGAVTPPADLLERDLELGQLEELRQEASRSGGRLALVAGEAGIGKTTLVETFARDPSGSLWGSCDALLTPRPLGPVQDFAPRLSQELCDLIAGAAPRHLILAASLSALEALPKPAVLVLEDLHWADEATLDWLKFIGRRLPRLVGLLVLATYRDDEVGAAHPLRAVLGELPLAATRRLFLQPLSPQAVQALARSASRSAEGLWEITEGNPFFVTEALSAPRGEVPATVRDAVIARAARLGPAARRVLEIASAVPARVEPWLLEAVAGEYRSAVDECIDLGVLRSGESGFSFRHELARRAIEESLHRHQHRELHARVLGALRERVGAAGRLSRLAYHAEQAGDLEAILEHSPAAAREAAALGAHREAVAHYGAVLRHGQGLAKAERADLWHARAYQAFLADDFETSRPAQERAISLWREVGRKDRVGESQRRLSRLAYFEADGPSSWSYARAAVETLEALPQSSELALAYAHLAQLHLENWQLESAEEWGGKALAVASRLDDVEARVYALSAAGAARFRLGQTDGLGLVKESLGLAETHHLEELYARSCGNLVEAYLYSRRYAEAEPYLKRSIEFAQARDADACAHFYHALRSRQCLEQGDWVGATEGACRALAHPRVHAVSRMVALTILGRTRLRLGDPGWRETLDEAWQLARASEEPQRLAPAAAAWAEAAWLHGEDEPARAIVTQAYETTLPSRDPWAVGELAYWGWKAGLFSPRTEAAAEPFALHLRGEWQDAAAHWERLGCPYEAALAWTEGDQEARAEGLERLNRLGAKPAVAAVTRGSSRDPEPFPAAPTGPPHRR